MDVWSFFGGFLFGKINAQPNIKKNKQVIVYYRGGKTEKKKNGLAVHPNFR